MDTVGKKPIGPKVYVEHVRNKFIEIFPNSINQMSEHIIKRMNDVLKASHVKLKTDHFEEQFKADMLDKWLNEFNAKWSSRELDKYIARLKMCQIDAEREGRTDKKAWRPYGKSATEQIRPVRVMVMEDLIKRLQIMLEQQSEELHALIFEIEEKRAYCEQVAKRREKISHEMDTCIQELLKEKKAVCSKKLEFIEREMNQNSLNKRPSNYRSSCIR